MAEELVSPELVLVDAELATRWRATGPVTDCLAPRAPAPPSPAPLERHRRVDRLRTAVLLVSLAINAVLLGAAWSDGIAPSAPPTVPSGVHVTGIVPEVGDAVHSTIPAAVSSSGGEHAPCQPA